MSSNTLCFPPTPEHQHKRLRKLSEDSEARQKWRQRSSEILLAAVAGGGGGGDAENETTALHPLFPPTPIKTPKRQKAHRNLENHPRLLPNKSILARNPFKVFAETLNSEKRLTGKVEHGPSLDLSKDNPFISSKKMELCATPLVRSEKIKKTSLHSPELVTPRVRRSSHSPEKKRLNPVSPCKEGEIMFV